MLPSSIGQDATLSRWRERFDSARERHGRSHTVVSPSLFAIFPKHLEVVWGDLFARCSLSRTTARWPPRLQSASRGVSLCLGKCGVAERGHDLVSGAAGIGQHSAERLAEAVRPRAASRLFARMTVIADHGLPVAMAAFTTLRSGTPSGRPRYTSPDTLGRTPT